MLQNYKCVSHILQNYFLFVKTIFIYSFIFRQTIGYLPSFLEFEIKIMEPIA